MFENRRALVTFLCVLAGPLLAATVENTKVGNGDDGDDLEGAVPLTSGKIVEARTAAVLLLERLRTGSVRGLGLLIPEVEKTALYLAKRDVKDGHFARTMPEPHAPTRFFPQATKLDRDQLVTLHVHEGLHRVLPPALRGDEAVVSRIAQAITTPGATTDRVAAVMDDVLSKGKDDATDGLYIQAGDEPTNFSYGIRQYFGYAGGPAARVERWHVLGLELPSLRSGRFALRGYVGASLVEADTITLGPIHFEPRLVFVPREDYELTFWFRGVFFPATDAAWVLAFGGRDLYAVGLSARKDLKRIFLDLRIEGAIVRGTVLPKEIGSVLHTRLGAGVRREKFSAGAFVEMHIADMTNLGGRSFSLLSAGPEATWRIDDSWSLTASGRWALAGGNFDELGDLVRYGAGQGNLGLTLRYGL